MALKSGPRGEVNPCRYPFYASKVHLALLDVGESWKAGLEIMRATRLRMGISENRHLAEKRQSSGKSGNLAEKWQSNWLESRHSAYPPCLASLSA